MIAALLKNLDKAINGIPAHSRWLVHCHQSVFAAYLHWRRTLLTRQVPAFIVLLIAHSLLKQTQLVGADSTALIALLAASFVALSWPPSIGAFALSAWRGASLSPAYSVRLKVLSFTFMLIALISTMGIALCAYVLLHLLLAA